MLKPLKAAFFMRYILASTLILLSLGFFAQGLVFDSYKIDLGDIKQSDVKEFFYKYENTSTLDTIIINDVLPQCGCTSVDFDQTIVYPNGVGELMFKFDPGEKLGFQRKTITVLIEGCEPVVLVFSANVIVSGKKVKGKTSPR